MLQDCQSDVMNRMTKEGGRVILAREVLSFVTHSPHSDDALGANLGFFDGEVSHRQINRAIAAGAKTILLGEQTRLPYFPDDDRLPKLHAGDPLVLLLWKVLRKIPETLRKVLLHAPLSVTLLRGDNLLYFETYRHHQAIHIGCRRRTIYLPEMLLHAAEDRGYDYWAVAEGVIYGAWLLLDYLLLVDTVRDYRDMLADMPNLRLNRALQSKLIERNNRHRLDSLDAHRSELGEFADAYRSDLTALRPEEIAQGDSFAVGRALFNAEREDRWAREKMERIANLFDFPNLFLFDRDIIHGVARDLAVARNLPIEPRVFDDVLHDYRDALRFERTPLKTTLGKSVMPKPRAVFLQTLVALGARGLRGFFRAYGEREDGPVRDLMHPLWMYLCSLSSDPAGVFSRMGRCRAIGREGIEEDWDRYLAGVLIRLDKADNYEQLVAEVGKMGGHVREELADLVRVQRLGEEDEWEAFKGRKQRIVTHACIALDELDGVGDRLDSVDWHADERVRTVLADRPHRLSSDPSGVLMYMRTYQNALQRYGGEDPDSLFMLASILIRLDKSEDYPALVECVYSMGKPAFSAVHNVFEQIPERDMERREILKQARIVWSRLMARTRKRATKE